MKHILIGDHDPQVRQIVSDLVHRVLPDARVIQAQNGKEVKLLAIMERPDLIFLCACMPIMNGYETAYELRRMPRTRSIPLLGLVDEEATPSVVAGVERLVTRLVPRRPGVEEMVAALAVALPGIPLRPPHEIAAPLVP